MCVSHPSPQTNSKALKIKIYNDDAEMTLAVNGLVIIKVAFPGVITTRSKNRMADNSYEKSEVLEAEAVFFAERGQREKPVLYHQ